MRVAIDTEGNQLHPYLTRLWCCCAIDIDTDQEYTYTTASEFKEAAQHWTLIIGHGLLSYDLWALRKCWDVQFTVGPDTLEGRPVEFVDSLVWSRSLNPDRNGHGISDWGLRLGLPKLEFNDFSQYSEEMRTYCLRDCAVAAKTYRELIRERDQ